MSYEFIIYDKRPGEHMAVVTMNRPQVLNAMNVAATEELTEIWDDFAGDPELWVAILTGAGDRAFTVGNDLKDQSAKTWPPKRGPSGWGGLVTRFDLNKPVIAAVNGWALGGGLEISLACDIVIAAEHARFGCPEPRIGGVPTGAIHRLVRQVPWKTAMAMLYTGQPLDADEAYRAGLVNEVVPAHELLATAEQWALEITKSAPLGVQAAKEVARLGDGLSVQAAMEQSYAAIERVRASEDSVEGRKAFAEKRAPHWRGQ
jgi:enoyl-CoA hydratase/carnithine racemase